MFERLDKLPPDPILGLMAAFRADPDSQKVDLGVGVYRDELGNTPVLEAVRLGEQALLSRQKTKSYVSPAGNAEFNHSLERLTLGDDHPVLGAQRVRTIQATGGCGALRLGAELLRAAAPDTIIHVSTPTWANHVPLLTGAGIRLERYPYYDPATGSVQIDPMLAYLDRLPPRSVVLLHASCHNPTGADLNPTQWREVLAVVKKRELIPYLDMAYQGLAEGIAEDAFAPRQFAAELPEALIAVSCSKNFGLYRERTGALHVLNPTPVTADAVLTQLVRIARTIYSMPPDHGAAIVQEILSTPALKTTWLRELDGMRNRINTLRRETVAQLAKACPQRDFSFIERQRGMFSYLGVSPEQVKQLRTQQHIYMMDDGRVNIAGLRSETIPYFAKAVAQVS
jgi:aspartate aminotransferase